MMLVKLGIKDLDECFGGVPPSFTSNDRGGSRIGKDRLNPADYIRHVKGWT